MNYDQILEARRLFEAGQNVSQRFREAGTNPLPVLELVYDLQAGSYVEYAEKHRASLEDYADEMAAIARRHIESPGSILDVGCGELTTLSFFLSKIPELVTEAHAFDVSLSRLRVGEQFARQNMGPASQRLNIVAAELQALPYRTASIDVSVSNHALEPNGGQERAILSELFRVTKNLLILFEPCYETASEDAKNRMTSMGYVKGLEKVARELGAEVVEIVPMTNIRNPLNPTACFVIRPPQKQPASVAEGSVYALPGTDLPVDRTEHGYISPDTGILFPIVTGIPILRKNAGIYATSLLNSR